MNGSFIKERSQFDKVCFYIMAHADDWQLFMQPNAFTDITAAGCKVVFIVTTAGDAGIGDNFWRAREEGMKSSIRFCIAPISSLEEFRERKICNSRPIMTTTINNTVAYFLRLPDGNLDGNGFAVNNFKSLGKLRSETVASIQPVDNCGLDYTWPDFVGTIESIIKAESENISTICIHYLNPDHIVENPNDHPDHVATGAAIQQIMLQPNAHQFLYRGYSVNTDNNSLNSTDIFWKAGIFAAYEKTVYDLCGYSTLQENVDLYCKWCSCAAGFLTVESIAK